MALKREICITVGDTVRTFPTELDPSNNRGIYDEIVKIHNREKIFDYPGEMTRPFSEKYFYNGLRGSNRSFDGFDIAATGVHSAILYSNPGDAPKVSPLIGTFDVDGKSVDVTMDNVAIEVRTNGIVLKMDGAIGSNFLGRTYECYLAKITSRNYKWGGIGGAKVFNSWKELGKFLEKQEDTMNYIVSMKNIEFVPEEIGIGVKSDEKSKAKVDDLLENINGVEANTEDTSDVPMEVTEEDIRKEIEYRMKKLDLWDEVVTGWKNDGKIYLSDNHIVFSLDDEAIKAIEAVRKNNEVPYHVILNHFKDYDTYDVLYVSKEPEAWKLERVSGDGWLMAYSWMVPFQDGEHGNIRVVSSAGGLQRIN